jgi:hypothetical protein
MPQRNQNVSQFIFFNLNKIINLEATMKKLAVILALMIIPCSAFGLEMLSDSTMDSVTGQAGVNIAVDDIQIFMNIEKLAWIDCDGFASWEGKGTCSGGAGAVFLNNFQIDVLNINAITGTFTEGTTNAGNGLDLRSTPCGNIPLFYDYATSAVGDGCFITGDKVETLALNNYYDHQGGNSAFVPHFLTIDATDDLPASTAGLQYWRTHAWTSAAVQAGTNSTSTATSSVGGVLIGIPTVEIYINMMTMTPMFDGSIGGQLATAANDDDVVDVNGNHKTFGTIYMKGITFTTLSGWIEISPK